LLDGAWTIEDITFGRNSPVEMLYLSRGPSVVRACIFIGDDLGYFGDPLVNVLLGSARMESCEMQRGGAAISLDGQDASAQLVNCAIHYVNDVVYGGDGSEVDMINCSVRDVTLPGGSVFAGFLSRIGVANSAIWNLSGGTFYGPGLAGDVRYSVVPAGVEGVGVIHDDPRIEPNWAPLPGSPCIDGADANSYSGSLTDLAGQPRGVDDPDTPNTGFGVPPLDIGCREFQPAPPCPGDFNGDGVLNIFDFLAFQTAFGSGC